MTWTIPTLRAHLGERGFLERVESRHKDADGYTVSSWYRENKILVLYEHKATAPILRNARGELVNPMDIGYRNINTANDGSPDE